MSRARRRWIPWIVVLVIAATWTGCGGKKKKQRAAEAQLVSSEERYAEGMAMLERRKLIQAVKLFSSINQYATGNRQEIEPLVRLALADATFYQSNDLAYIDARSAYLDFVTLYSDHPLAAYAQFQAGICSLKQVRHPSRDQTESYRAIAELQEVARRFPRSVFAEASRSMVREAEARLADHEILVAEFYATRKNYAASVERLRFVLDRFPDYTQKDKLYFYLGDGLIRANNTAEGRIYLDKLLKDYPGDNRYVGLARKALSDAGGPLALDEPAAQTNGNAP